MFIGCKSGEKIVKNDPTGDTFEVKVGKTFEIHFLQNASLGTRWTWKNHAEISIVDSIDITYKQKGPKGMVGKASDMYYKFEGKKIGTDTLEFWAYRTWEPENPIKIIKKVVIVK